MLGIVVAVLSVMLIGLCLHDTIERVVLERALALRVGGDTTIGRLWYDDAGNEMLGDVRLRTADGGVTATADRVELTPRAGGVAIVAYGLHLDVALDRLAGDEPQRLTGLAGGPFTLQLGDAAAAIGRSDVPGATLAVDRISGTLRVASEGPSYDLRGDVVAGGQRYPVSGTGSPLGDRLDQRWRAARLPLVALGALLPPSELAFSDGSARDVTLTIDGKPHLALTLAGGSAQLEGHALAALAGPVIVDGDGIGTTGITGTVDDGVPLSLAGEVHDPAGWGDALHAGVGDLHRLARLFGKIAAEADLKWMRFETTAPGITFGQFAVTTKGVPHVVGLLAVDPHEPTLRFDTALAADHIISGGARTTQLGIRTGAVAGVNGDYFDIGRTYEPEGLLVKSGVLLHSPTDHYALAFDRHNNLTFAVFHLTGQVVDGDRSYRISQINSWPARYVSVITPAYGKVLAADSRMSVAILEPLGGTRYRVASVERAAAPIPVTFALGLGFGTSIHEPLPQPGDVVDVDYGLDPAIPDLVTAISSGPLLLKDGAWFEDARAPAPEERDVQWPVIALGTTRDDGLLFAAVDGRHPERSIGMTRPEFADLLRRFGVIDAMALDSGGSVTMVSRTPGDTEVSLHNVPSDDSFERYISDALFIYSSAPPGTIVTAPHPSLGTAPQAPKAPT